MQRRERDRDRGPGGIDNPPTLAPTGVLACVAHDADDLRGLGIARPAVPPTVPGPAFVSARVRGASAVLVTPSVRFQQRAWRFSPSGRWLLASRGGSGAARGADAFPRKAGRQWLPASCPRYGESKSASADAATGLTQPSAPNLVAVAVSFPVSPTLLSSGE